MATDNPNWGYTRIRDALGNVGVSIGRTTVQEILRDHGIEPAPERRKRPCWRTFLRAHWGAIAAADLFTVEVLTLRGLVRYHVLFVIDLKTRRVEIAGIHPGPHGAWMVQIARNLTDAFDGFLAGTRYLILDRDPLYTREFRALLKSAGVEPVRLPARSPNLNAYASHCTSLVRLDMTFGKRLRSANLVPCILTGASSPGGSNRQLFLSLYGVPRSRPCRRQMPMQVLWT
jgi:transposase InsO family protein